MLIEHDEILSRLANLPGWEVKGDTIYKDYVFKDFHAALAFMNNVGEKAEDLGHHPDWSNSYNKVSVSLTTHSAGGLTAVDFKLAECMNDLFTN